MSYIRKNHLTINEDVEIYEVVSNDGKTVEWFGTEEQLSEQLNTERWECGDYISEPLREWAISRTRTLWDAARVVHKTELKEAGLYKLLEAYSRDELSGDEEEKINSIKRGVRERYERLKTRHEERCESLDVWK